MTPTPPLAPAITRRQEGEALWWLGALAEVRLTADQTAGTLSVIEVTEAPGAEAPLHVHRREDETFWVLEGEADVEVGGRTVHARAGDLVFGPRDVPHRYTAGPRGCRMLLILTPGGMERMVRQMSVPAGARTLPPPPEEEPDWERVGTVAEAAGCRLLC